MNIFFQKPPMWMRPSFLTPTILAAAVIGSAAAAELPETISFNRDIRPILSENCFQCHGFDKETREADLRLDVRESALETRNGYATIVPGNPGESELIYRIESDDEDDVMPPPDSEKSLTAHQKSLLRQWIEEGAAYEKHWAYIPPVRPAVPESGRFDNPVDAFVARRLDREGLEFSKEADARTMVRRLSFDLNGLPPEPGLVESYLRGDIPGGYEGLVDHFLNAPQFGERMAVYWLDLVRWADTMGFHSDDERRSTPYRDYVIDSFNENRPFDRFTIEQLAGDLLPDPTTSQLVASGYNRMNQVTGEGGAQPKEYRAKYMSDKTRNVASVWLGSTLMCAECHDHKFDPFTMKDFYSMAAFFADLDEPDLVSSGRRTGIFHPSIQLDPEISNQMDQIDTEIAALRESGADRNEIRKLEQKRERISMNGLWTVISKQREEPRMIRILPRGNFLDETGPLVDPAIPEFLGSISKDGRADRLDLARWLTSGENPLTSRVMVNRLWYLFFGSGLSAVLDDLGYQGEWPSHPDLLDWLAVEFMESGWDIKHMVRLLVTSSTYRQTSRVSDELMEVDAGNRLYARQSRFRLQAEFIRDTALEVSGLLTQQIGGPSARPYQPDGYWADSYKSVGVPHVYHQDTGEKLYRRGLYTFWKRTFVHPEMLTFDAPNREECVAQRPISNTPLQALVLLNDPAFVEASRVLAQTTVDQFTSPDLRLDHIYRRTLQRRPTSDERSVLLDLVKTHQAHFSANPEKARELLDVGEYPVPEHLPVTEVAAWTSAARAVLNLHETITRQ